jgi:glycosyltransferase involved in cell wall biosynthesis
MKNKSLPMVSTVIPVYNGTNFMREAIDSALNQTYSNHEVIVVNDGSTDDGATHEVALSYGDKIRYFLKENGRVSSALNYGIKKMRGEYFNWLSHDDIHYPEKIERQMDAILKYKGSKPVVCVSNYVIINEHGEELVKAPQDIGTYFKRSPKCFLGCETGFMIDGDATLISKSLFDKVGLFSEQLFASQETDLWFRSLDVAEFIFMPDYFVGYRSHSQQVTHERADAVGKEAGAYRGGITEQTDIQEVIKYIQSDKDAHRFGSSAYHYMSMSFYEACFQMIAKIRQLCTTDWHFMRGVLKGMFLHEGVNIDMVLNVLIDEISVETTKKKILVYCDNWNEDFYNRLLDLMEKKTEYSFFLVYCGTLNRNVPSHITCINFEPFVNYHMASYLAILSELLKVDVFWNNAYYTFLNTSAFSYLRDSKIKTIASFNYHMLGPTVLHPYLDEKIWLKPLINANIITHEKHDESLTVYIYPFDAIYMPSISGNPRDCEIWSKLLNTITSAGKADGSNLNDFEHINGADFYLYTEDDMNKIQRVLINYEARSLQQVQYDYESSIFWKITKPLRVTFDILRKIRRK